jgi:hypothetical protein
MATAAIDVGKAWPWPLALAAAAGSAAHWQFEFGGGLIAVSFSRRHG